MEEAGSNPVTSIPWQGQPRLSEDGEVSFKIIRSRGEYVVNF